MPDVVDLVEEGDSPGAAEHEKQLFISSSIVCSPHNSSPMEGFLNSCTSSSQKG